MSTGRDREWSRLAQLLVSYNTITMLLLSYHRYYMHQKSHVLYGQVLVRFIVEVYNILYKVEQCGLCTGKTDTV